MEIVFRADASILIGIGHVMRCLTLAAALREAGAICRFVCREHVGHCINEIQRQGFQVCVLPDSGRETSGQLTYDSDYAEWLGEEGLVDANQMVTALNGELVDWIVVDHYGIDSRWESMLQANCKQMMVIDDLFDKPHSCDILLNQNLGVTEKEYYELLSPKTHLLLGPEYALLRPQFRAHRQGSLKRRKGFDLKTILVTLGGIDKNNVTAAVLAAVEESSIPKNITVNVVMGASAPWFEDIRRAARRMSHQVNVMANVQNMAQVMADSDLAIGAAGGTSWERCCLGLPTLLVTLAANQQKVAVELATRGCVKLLGNKADVQASLPRMLSLMQDLNELQTLSKNSATICDGDGAHRVTQKILNYRA
jgi:UDP-2,4-diacetamido-2,4,6-trideoxy-beta-L-altropyranose hydrolase